MELSKFLLLLYKPKKYIMGRGIIKTRPGELNQTAKIIVTVDDSGDPATAFDPGTELEYKNDIGVNLSDEVEFSFDPVTKLAEIKMVTKPGRLITSDSSDDITIGSGEVAMIKGAKTEGKIIVKGGVLAIVENATITGKLQSLIANSFILANGVTFEGKVESSNGGYLSLEKCTVYGKVVSDRNEYVGIIGCTIHGKVEVTNAKKYRTS